MNEREDRLRLMEINVGVGPDPESGEVAAIRERECERDERSQLLQREMEARRARERAERADRQAAAYPADPGWVSRTVIRSIAYFLILVCFLLPVHPAIFATLAFLVYAAYRAIRADQGW